MPADLLVQGASLMVTCIKHGSLVPEHEAQIVGWDDTGSGPGVAKWACHPCVHEHGLLPPVWTGRRNAAPVPPGEPA
jgi:hypothetical protein